MTDANGARVEFEFLCLLEYRGEEYVVLLPVGDDPDGAGEVMILKVEAGDDPDEESYAGVEDEEVLDGVFKLFKRKFRGDFDFID